MKGSNPTFHDFLDLHLEDVDLSFGCRGNTLSISLDVVDSQNWEQAKSNYWRDNLIKSSCSLPSWLTAATSLSSR